MANNDAWRETCLIALCKQAGSDVRFHGLTETIDIDLADKDIEGIALVNGGRVKRYTPQGDTTVTLEAYSQQVGTTAGTAGYGFWDLMNTADASQPISITNDRTRDEFRLAILWTEDTDATDANAAVNGTYACRRFAAADGNIISVKDSFTDGVLKSTIVFKVTAFDKSAAGNMKWESTNSATGSLTALSSYTSSAKW